FQNLHLEIIMAPKRSAEISSNETKTSKKKSKNVSNEDSEEGQLVESTCPMPYRLTAALPTRDKEGKLVFEDAPEFRPNRSPKEVLQAGSFGGTYYRPIKSGVTGEKYDSSVWKELPKDWLEGLKIAKQVSSSIYDASVNKYGAKCGGDLEMWESSGWIVAQDPYGWFQWYCRYYQGRRSEDDDRQIGRWNRCTGDKGRWRQNLIAKCVRGGFVYDNFAVSPVVRQTLLHWGYELTESDFKKGEKKVKK
ncbi:unnamed protein product, partial [Meganyctiphanes norvegica]